MRAALLALAFLSSGALAATPSERPLSDPALEARAQHLADEIRCVVCENEPVSQSQADIAVDMRHVIRDRLVAGDTDNQVRDYFADRYGDFVLLNPRITPTTLVLWGAPFLLMLFGGLFLWFRAKRSETLPDDDPKLAIDALKGLEN